MKRLICIQKNMSERKHLIIGPVDMDLKNLYSLVGIFIAIIFVSALSVSHGVLELTFTDVIYSFMGHTLTADQEFAIYDSRLPRLIMAGMVGFCIAMVGAILQSLMRNPLADASLLGLSQGSIVAIMVVLFYFPSFPFIYLPFVALSGGLFVGLLLLILVGKYNQGGIAILLMGVAVTTTLSSISSMFLLHFDVSKAYSIGLWTQGSLGNSIMENAFNFFIWFIVALSGLVFICRPIRIYDLGDQLALSLGENIGFSKITIIVFAVLITSASVSAVGPIAFLGILCPHLCDFITISNGRTRILLSGFMGAFVLITADMLTRLSTGAYYMPIGLTTVIVGAPLFFITLRLQQIRQTRQ